MLFVGQPDHGVQSPPLAEVLGVGNMPWAEGPLKLRFFLLLQDEDSGHVLWAGGLRAGAGAHLVLRR